MSRPDVTTAAPTTSAPRFAMGWAALVYALSTLALAYPALSGQFLVNTHSDQYIAGFAYRDFAAQSLRAGLGIPQWNPYIFGGMPYVAAMHGDIFYPTALLRMIMPTDVGMTWGFIIHLFLAGLFTYGFLRAWGIDFLPSLIGGLAYMLGGPVASYASPGHDGKLFVSALLPLALWMLVRGMRDGRMWAWGMIAITVGLAALSPHPQLLQYLLLTSGAFALYLAMSSDEQHDRLDRRTAVQRLSLALGAVVLGLAISAIQYAPVREYVAWSPRAGGHDYAIATSYSFPLIELVNTYLPQFTGMVDHYWGENYIHLHSEYIGGTVLLLVTAAFGVAARKSFRRFWLGAGLVALVWMLGSSTPFFRIIYEVVPGTKFFRAPSTIIYVFSFALSVLAALGTERILSLQVSKRLLYVWIGVGAFVALLGTTGILASITEGEARSIWTRKATEQGIDPANVAQAIAPKVATATDNAGALLIGSWRSFVFVALLAGALLASMRGALPRRTLEVAIALLVALDLWSIARSSWMFSPPAKVLYASDPSIEFLKREPEPGRVLVRALSPGAMASRDPYFGNDGIGTGTGLMVHGIRSATGYHGNEIGRYQLLEETRVGQGQGIDAFMLPTFWRHENVRYLYTNTAVADSQLKLLVGPVKNSAGSTVYLYRLAGNNPYAWVTAGATKASDSDAQQAILDPRFDPTRLAVYSDTNPVAIAPVTSLPVALAITTSTSNFGPGHATITLSAPTPAGASLVVAENFYPGWVATVDGKSTPAYRADFNLIGIPLPAGAKIVDLSFHDAAIGMGKAVTIVALLLALAALAGGVVVDRRRLV